MNYFLAPHDRFTLEYISKEVCPYFGLKTLKERKRGRLKQFERQMFCCIVRELGVIYPDEQNQFGARVVGKFLGIDHSSVVHQNNNYKAGYHINDWNIIKDNYVTNHFYSILSIFTGKTYFDYTKQFTFHKLEPMDFELMDKIWVGGECYILLDEYCELVDKKRNTVERLVRNHKLKSRKFKVNGKLRTHVKIK